MRVYDVAIISLRFAAVYLVAQGIVVGAQMTTLWAAPYNAASGSIRVLAASALLAPALVGVILWLLAPFLARLMIRGTSATDLATGLTPEDLTRCGLLVVGIYILVVTLPNLLQVFVALTMEPEGRDVSHAIAVTLQCLLAVGLIVGSERIARSLRWARHVRTSK